MRARGLTSKGVVTFAVVVCGVLSWTAPALAAQAPVIEAEPEPGEEHGLTVGQTTARVTAVINPELQETTCTAFDYGLSESYGSEAPCAPSELGAGSFGEVTSASLTGLTPNTVYHYQVLASNATGTSEGATALGDKTFLTLPALAIVKTGVASAVTASTARIAGTVDPGSSGHSEQDDTTYYFEYGGTTAYGRRTPTVEVGEGTSAQEVTATLALLEPGVTYHYRIVASNVNNAVEPQRPQLAYGEDSTFETLSTPPILSAATVSAVSQNAATISATLDPQGLPTRYELRVGLTPGVLQAQSAGNTSSATPVVVTLGSAEALSPGTVYYYKLVASNPDDPINPDTNEPEPVETPEGSFTTAPAPSGAPPGGLPATIPFQSIAELNAKEAREDKGIPVRKSLTNAEKLSNALRACRRERKKSARQKCEKTARKDFVTKTKKRVSKKK